MMGGAPAAILGHGMVVSTEKHVEGGSDRSPILGISMVSCSSWPPPCSHSPLFFFYRHENYTCLVLSLS